MSMFEQPRISVPREHCGQCGDAKIAREYQGPHGRQKVTLCVRCDLTPEPPLRVDPRPR